MPTIKEILNPALRDNFLQRLLPEIAEKHHLLYPDACDHHDQKLYLGIIPKGQTLNGIQFSILLCATCDRKDVDE